jgi:hypothetical protein
MPHANERVEPEMKITRHRQVARRTADEKFLTRRIKAQIAERERKLRRSARNAQATCN